MKLDTPSALEQHHFLYLCYENDDNMKRFLTDNGLICKYILYAIYTI